MSRRPVAARFAPLAPLAGPAAAIGVLTLVVFAAAGPGFDRLIQRPLAVTGLLLIGAGLCRLYRGPAPAPAPADPATSGRR